MFDVRREGPAVRGRLATDNVQRGHTGPPQLRHPAGNHGHGEDDIGVCPVRAGDVFAELHSRRRRRDQRPQEQHERGLLMNSFTENFTGTTLTAGRRYLQQALVPATPAGQAFPEAQRHRTGS